MTNDVDSKLDDIFNSRAERLAAAAHAQQEKEMQQDATVVEFLALKESLIRPTLEALAQKLSDKGQESKIFEVQDGERGSGSVQDAKIGIRFLLDERANYARGNEYPHLTLSLDKASRKVQFYKSTMTPSRGGMAGGDGSVDLGSLTEQLINQKALSVIGEVYK